jgi:excisionase family DNA binding protein
MSTSKSRRRPDDVTPDDVTSTITPSQRHRAAPSVELPEPWAHALGHPRLPLMQTVKATSARTGIPEKTLRGWIYEGRLTTVRAGSSVLIPTASLLEFLRLSEATR